MAGRHTRPPLRPPQPVSLNRLPFLPFRYFPLPSLSLTVLSDEQSGIVAGDRTTADLVSQNLHATAREISDPPANWRLRQIQWRWETGTGSAAGSVTSS